MNDYLKPISTTKTHERTEADGATLLRYQGLPEGTIKHCVIAPSYEEPSPSVFAPTNSDNAKAVELPMKSVPSDPYAVSEFSIDSPKVELYEEKE